MSKKTYVDKANEPYKQLYLGNNLFSDSYMSEADYMAISPIWQTLREARMKKDNQRCVQCGKAHPLQVHHRRYPPAWGLEKIEDLVTLCDSCHAGIHDKKED